MSNSEIIAAAQRELEPASAPDGLRKVAFSKAVDLVVGSIQVQTREIPVAMPENGSQSADYAYTALRALAKRTGLDVEIVSKVCFETDGQLRVGIPVIALDNSTSGGTPELAFLVPGGRQSSGEEDAPIVGEIRVVCEHYEKSDPSNFAATVSSVDDLLIIRGRGRHRPVKMSQPAWARLARS